MPVIRANWITRADVRANPTTLYCYGDNMQRRGLGGQAREMRGEPNAVGIVTKWRPSNDADAFFDDADYNAVAPVIVEDVAKLCAHLRRGGTVVIPAHGIGTGLADLRRRAPCIAALVDELLGELDAVEETPL